MRMMKNPDILKGHKKLKEWQHTMRHMEPYRNQRALWLAGASGLLLTGSMILGAISPRTHMLEDNFHPGYSLMANLVFFTALYCFNFWILRMGIDAKKTLLYNIGGTVLITFLLSSLYYFIEQSYFGAENTYYNYNISLIFYSTAALIALLIVELLKNVTQHQQTVVENEHLQAENMLIRYETLEHQVGPHFLFNSLNTLDGLIGTNDDNAHEYLHQLAAIFRYTLRKEKEVTLAEELEFCHSFIYLMKIRHGDSLTIEEHIDPALMTTRMVPISLQLLIENAIKHNVVSARHPMHIDITTTDDDYIRVVNPLQPKADIEASTGIGLVNLSQRYDLLFHREIRIHQDETHFTVEIPLIK